MTRRTRPVLLAAALLLAACGVLATTDDVGSGEAAPPAAPSVGPPAAPSVGPSAAPSVGPSAAPGTGPTAAPSPTASTSGRADHPAPDDEVPRDGGAPADAGAAGGSDEVGEDGADAASVVARPAGGASEPPAWFGTASHPDTATGYPAPQPVPEAYVDRRLVTEDVLPPPPGDAFVHSVGPVPDDVLARSTWTPACPVTPDRLAYVTVSFWGFDGLHHTGELLLADHLADDAVAVFALLHEQRFPIERMVVTSQQDLDGFHNRGDDNTTTAFECRPVTGGGGWSRHAQGRAIDINPFHNPYVRDGDAGRVLLPVYAGAYLDRGRDVPGTIDEGDPVVALFDELGWEWGGRWRTLKDWQHVVCREGAPCDR